MGGEISCFSKKGEGAIFDFFIAVKS